MVLFFTNVALAKNHAVVVPICNLMVIPVNTCDGQRDCNKDCNGTAYVDSCGFCVGGNTGKTSLFNCVASAGQTWMDRNLGAERVAAALDDPAAYGDLYQWGRLQDGHEQRNSLTSDIKSDSDTPGHGKFITGLFDWREPSNNNLWQDSGINNPCPDGFKVPTADEWEIERKSWSNNSAVS